MNLPNFTPIIIDNYKFSPIPKVCIPSTNCIKLQSWFKMGKVPTEGALNIFREPLKATMKYELFKGKYCEHDKSIKFMPREQNREFLPWEINDLVQFFQSATIPPAPVRINPYSTIWNTSMFIDSHLALIKAQNGKSTFRPYLERLIQLKECLNAAGTIPASNSTSQRIEILSSTAVPDLI